MKERFKKVLMVMLSGIFVLSIFGRLPQMQVQAAFSGAGDGTSGNPYIVTSAAQLDEVRDDLAAHYKLGNDIDLTTFLQGTTEGWEPIGNNLEYFTGYFDGNGHKITGLWINRPSEDDIGLFGMVEFITIKNLGIEIAAQGVKGQHSVGGLIGTFFRDGNITNCYTTGGNVTSAGRVVGGLVGTNNSHIESCYSNCPVDNIQYWQGTSTGGLAGHSSGNIKNSYATGNISARYEGPYDSQRQIRIGGLVGRNLGDIENSYATGDVVVTGNDGFIYVGGLVGESASAGMPVKNNINNSYATGKISSMHGLYGGLVGYIPDYHGNITNCFFDTETTEQSNGIGHGDGSAIVFGKTTAEMKQRSTFTTELGAEAWDFNNIWAIRSNINSGYPYLGSHIPKYLTFGPATKAYTGSSQATQITPTASGTAIGFSGADVSDVYYNSNTTAPASIGSYTISIDIADDGPSDVKLNGTYSITKTTLTAADFNYDLSSKVNNGSPNPVTVTGNGTFKSEIDSLMNSKINVEYSPDGANTWTTTAPTNVGTYNVRVVVSDAPNFEDIIISLGNYSITPTPTFGISLDVSGTETFAGAEYGYGNAPAAIDVLVTNTGNQPTGPMTVSLTGAGSSSFDLSTSSLNSISVAGTETFSVRPITGLAAGTHTAIVTVSGTSITSQNFNVEFVVDKKTLAWNSNGTVNAKEYDGTYGATVETTPTLVGVVGTDNVIPSAGAVLFNGTAAGNHGITASGWGIAGTHAANYNAPTAQPVFASADITKRSVTFAGIVSVTKQYDGTTAFINDTIAITDSSNFNRKIGTDDISLNKTGVTGTFGPNVGTGSLVVSGTFTIFGAAAGNYVLAVQPTVAASITKASGAGVGAPTASNVEETSFVANANLETTTGQNIEYAIGPNNTAPSTSWQISATFNGLTPNTDYYIFARSVSNDNYNTGTHSVSVSPVRTADNTPPTGEVHVGTHMWNNFWNTVTFGLFFKETQTVTVTNVQDNSEQTVTVHYYLADSEKTELELVSETWTPYPNGGFTIDPNNKFVIYVKLTDLKGNTAYLNSAGVVLYTDITPITASLNFVKESAIDENVTVNLNSNTVSKIMNGGTTLINGTHYTVDNGIGLITFKASYLNTLATGSYTLTVHYNPLGVEYPETSLAGSVAPATTAITLSVTPAPVAPTITTTSPMPGGKYNASYSQQLTATGDLPMTWTLESGSLPSGLTLSTAGLISGTSTADGTFTFTVKAENVAGSDTKSLSITISKSNAANVIAVISPSDATINGTTITATVGLEVENQLIDVTVSPKASWKLYSDILLNNEITDKTMALVAGPNISYLEVTAEDASKQVYTVTITRTNIPVSGITIIGGTTINTKNGTLQLSANITPTNATNQNIVWAISSGDSATVDQTGLVSAVRDGASTIRATAQDGTGVYGEILINVSGQSEAAEPFEQWLVVEGYRIGLKAPAGVFEPGSTFFAREIIYDREEDREEFLKITNDKDLAYKEFYDTIGIYEFYVLDPHGNKYKQLNDFATLYIEVEGDFDPNNVIAIRIEEGEDVPLVNIRKEIIDEKIYFLADLDHFSYYALATKNILKTGDQTLGWVIGITTALIISIGALIWFNRKKT